MLGDYIDQYVEAYKRKDRKEMERIERELSKVGMDKYTLMLIIGDRIRKEIVK
jgi:uncharacterized membrane protein (DUF106 family)